MTWLENHPGYAITAALWALVTAEAPAITVAGWLAIGLAAWLHYKIIGG